MAIHVPTSEYRAKMRAWHERAQGGDEIIVTDHGEPVVRVIGATTESVLDRLAREGLVRRGRPRRPSSEIGTTTGAPTIDASDRDR